MFKEKIITLHLLQSMHVTYVYACMYLCMYVFTIYESSGGAMDLIPFWLHSAKIMGLLWP